MNAKKIDQSASSKTASSKTAAQVGKKAEELQGSRLLSDIEAFKAGCIASDGKSNGPVRSARPSLLDAIEAHRAGLAAFEAINSEDWPAHGGEDAVIAKTWGPPHDVLREWSQPASNEEEAIAALHLAKKEDEGCMGSDIASAMLRAALAYFDGRENVRDDGPLSLKPSADIDFALKAISFFEKRSDELNKQYFVYEREYFDGRFKGDFKAWEEWVKGTPHGHLCEQYEAFTQLSRDLERFVRACDCNTVGDLVAKIQLDAGWIKACSQKELVEDYPEEACALMASILPLVERLTANRG